MLIKDMHTTERMPVVAIEADTILNGGADTVFGKDMHVLSPAVCTQVHFIQASPDQIMNAQAQEVADTLPLDGFPPEIVANIQIITKAEAWLQTIEEEYSNVPDVATKNGMATAREWRRNLVTARTQGNAARLAAGRPLTEMKKKIDDTWKKYEPRIKALEDPLDAAIKAVEEAAEREKEKNRQAEAARVKRIEDLIDDIRAAPIRAVTLEDIKDQILMLRDVDMASFDEYIDAGRIHVDSAMKALNDRLNLLIEQAEETKRLEASKIAQEARQAELDAQAARQAAELKAQQDAMAEQQRKLDEQAAEMGRRQLEQDEREAAEKKRAAEAETARVSGIVVRLKKIKTLAAGATSLQDAGYALKTLIEMRGTLPSFDEYRDEAATEIEDSMRTVKEAMERFRKEIEEKNIQAEKDAAEQAKRDEEAAEAEAARIAAMAPDIEKLRLYFSKLDKVKQPDVKSDEANYLLDRNRKALDSLMSDLDKMEQR